MLNQKNLEIRKFQKDTNIDKLKLSYKLSINNYRKEHKSVHWNNFLKEKFLNIQIKDLHNFRNNNLSDGMDNVRLNQPLNELRFKQFKDFLKENNQKIDNYYNIFPKINIGNCLNQIVTKEGFVDFIFIENLMFYIELEKYIFSKNKINNVCEIGGGFGSLARIINSKKKIQYFLIDLPETNFLSSFYLSQNLKEKKIFTYDNVIDNCVNNEDIKNYDIIILPPWVNFKNIKFDLFINTRSMMEMNLSIIDEYFKFIENNISNNGFFYNCNRYYKDTSGFAIKFHKYPYDDFWKVVYSEPTWCQRRLHTLITQRSSVKLDDIKKVMKKIGILSKSHTPHFLQSLLLFRKIKDVYKIFKKQR